MEIKHWNKVSTKSDESKSGRASAMCLSRGGIFIVAAAAATMETALVAEAAAAVWAGARWCSGRACRAERRPGRSQPGTIDWLGGPRLVARRTSAVRRRPSPSMLAAPAERPTRPPTAHDAAPLAVQWIPPPPILFFTPLGPDAARWARPKRPNDRPTWARCPRRRPRRRRARRESDAGPSSALSVQWLVFSLLISIFILPSFGRLDFFTYYYVATGSVCICFKFLVGLGVQIYSLVVRNLRAVSAFLMELLI